MAGLVDVIIKYTRPYAYYILAITLLIIFLSATLYFYPKFMEKHDERNDVGDVANSNRRNIVAQVMFFNVDWCPHCKTALPEWKTFVSQYNGKVINGYLIKCKDVNCTKDSDPEIITMIQKYNIDSYPTVKMLKGKEIINFESKITSTALDRFVNTMLTQ
jgi:thiol-disulfide isomerase/thioredoxin